MLDVGALEGREKRWRRVICSGGLIRNSYTGINYYVSDERDEIGCRHVTVSEFESIRQQRI